MYFSTLDGVYKANRVPMMDYYMLGGTLLIPLYIEIRVRSGGVF